MAEIVRPLPSGAFAFHAAGAILSIILIDAIVRVEGVEQSGGQLAGKGRPGAYWVWSFPHIRILLGKDLQFGIGLASLARGSFATSSFPERS